MSKLDWYTAGFDAAADGSLPVDEAFQEFIDNNREASLMISETTAEEEAAMYQEFEEGFEEHDD